MISLSWIWVFNLKKKLEKFDYTEKRKLLELKKLKIKNNDTNKGSGDQPKEV